MKALKSVLIAVPFAAAIFFASNAEARSFWNFSLGFQAPIVVQQPCYQQPYYAPQPYYVAAPAPMPYVYPAPQPYYYRACPNCVYQPRVNVGAGIGFHIGR